MKFGATNMIAIGAIIGIFLATTTTGCARNLFSRTTPKPTTQAEFTITTTTTTTTRKAEADSTMAPTTSSPPPPEFTTTRKAEEDSTEASSTTSHSPPDFCTCVHDANDTSIRPSNKPSCSGVDVCEAQDCYQNNPHGQPGFCLLTARRTTPLTESAITWAYWQYHRIMGALEYQTNRLKSVRRAQRQNSGGTTSQGCVCQFPDNAGDIPEDMQQYADSDCNYWQNTCADSHCGVGNYSSGHCVPARSKEQKQRAKTILKLQWDRLQQEKNAFIRNYVKRRENNPWPAEPVLTRHCYCQFFTNADKVTPMDQAAANSQCSMHGGMCSSDITWNGCSIGPPGPEQKTGACVVQDQFKHLRPWAV